MNKIKSLAYITTALIAVVSFTVSFNAVSALAFDSGMTGVILGLPISAMFAALVDGLIIVASLSLLNSKLQGERVGWQWFLLVTMTVVSVGFNYLHSPENITAQLVHIIPPIVLALSLHLSTDMVGKDIQRTGLRLSLDKLRNSLDTKLAELKVVNTELDDARRDADMVRKQLDIMATEAEDARTSADAMRTERDKKQAELDKVVSSLDNAKAELKYTNELLDAAKGGLDNLTQKQVDKVAKIGHAITLVRQGNDNKIVAETLGVDPKTVQRWLGKLNGKVK